MITLKNIRNYFFYCGLEKDDYNVLKKDAYVSNFRVWRLLHYLMAAVFSILFILSLFNDLMKQNKSFYFFALIYSAVAVFLFSILKEDSILAQFLIYLSISVLFLFGCMITQNKPDVPAVTFIAMLLITPMVMIDKPYFMALELTVASVVFLIWMYPIKTYEIWKIDMINVITFTIVGIILNVLSNSIRIREFVLTREIKIQKDTDELTGLKNKAALTREINEFMEDESTDKGIMFILDIDHFKSINDTFGHDIGDKVIHEMGAFLKEKSIKDEIVGRFGGDEFVVFIKNTDDIDAVREFADEIITGASEYIELPDKDRKISVSIGASIYDGNEHNYSILFKRADEALYKVKADREIHFCVYEG